MFLLATKYCYPHNFSNITLTMLGAKTLTVNERKKMDLNVKLLVQDLCKKFLTLALKYNKMLFCISID